MAKQKKPRKSHLEAKKSIDKKRHESPSRNELALMFAKMESKKINKRNDVDKKINFRNLDDSRKDQAWLLNENNVIENVEAKKIRSPEKKITLEKISQDYRK